MTRTARNDLEAAFRRVRLLGLGFAEAAGLRGAFRGSRPKVSTEQQNLLRLLANQVHGQPTRGPLAQTSWDTLEENDSKFFSKSLPSSLALAS